jgi:hypothetical protein
MVTVDQQDPSESLDRKVNREEWVRQEDQEEAVQEQKASKASLDCLVTKELQEGKEILEDEEDPDQKVSVDRLETQREAQQSQDITLSVTHKMQILPRRVVLATTSNCGKDTRSTSPVVMA